MINKESLGKILAEKEALKTKTEVIYHQLNGQIAILKELIKEAE